MAIVTHLPPKSSFSIADVDPVMFWAGPIQGAPDWQREATEIVSKLKYTQTKTIHVANPRREYVDGTFDYAEQVQWEKRHILRAAKYGAVLFWFAKQDSTLEYEEGRAYAQTSRVEFGRVCGWKDYARNINLVIGIEPGYTGSERYFRTCAEEFDIPVHHELNTAVEAAVQLIIER